MAHREPDPPFDAAAFVRDGGIDAQLASALRQTRDYWLRQLDRILAGEVKAVGLDEATKSALRRDVTKLRRALRLSLSLEGRRQQTRDRVRRFRERQRGLAGLR